MLFLVKPEQFDDVEMRSETGENLDLVADALLRTARLISVHRLQGYKTVLNILGEVNLGVETPSELLRCRRETLMP